MERKDYKLEIVGYLARSRSHVRGIAQKLGTNHMMIVRKIKELLEGNVVDYSEEGKNKSYFLKKNIRGQGIHIYV